MTITQTPPDIRALVREILADHLPGRTVRTAVIAMSRDDNPKATIMAFADGSATPVLALKVALTPGASPAVSAEAAALLRLEHLDATRAQGTVPECLEVRCVDATTALVMTARPGVPLAIDYHRWRHTNRPEAVRRDYTCAGRWLQQVSQLALQSTTTPAWGETLRRRWPGDQLAVAAAAATERLAARLGPAGAGGVCHGDFWCGNVLQLDGVVTGVVDWEHASFGADCVRDRVRFALSYSLYLDRHARAGSPVRGHRGLVARQWGDGIRYAVTRSGWYGDLLSGFVGDGLVASGRPRRLWRDAMLLGLAEIAALSDEDMFARQHLELLAGLAT